MMAATASRDRDTHRRSRSLKGTRTVFSAASWVKYERLETTLIIDFLPVLRRADLSANSVAKFLDSRKSDLSMEGKASFIVSEKLDSSSARFPVRSVSSTRSLTASRNSFSGWPMIIEPFAKQKSKYSLPPMSTILAPCPLTI